MSVRSPREITHKDKNKKKTEGFLANIAHPGHLVRLSHESFSVLHREATSMALSHFRSRNKEENELEESPASFQLPGGEEVKKSPGSPFVTITFNRPPGNPAFPLGLRREGTRRMHTRSSLSLSLLREFSKDAATFPGETRSRILPSRSPSRTLSPPVTDGNSFPRSLLITPDTDVYRCTCTHVCPCVRCVVKCKCSGGPSNVSAYITLFSSLYFFFFPLSPLLSDCVSRKERKRERNRKRKEREREKKKRK